MQPISFTVYAKALKKRLPVIVLISVLLAVVSYGIVARVKPRYLVHYSYIVSLSQREPKSDYRFDGFYALQATDLFAATLNSWVQAPEVVVKAYEAAGLVLPSQDAREVAKAVSAQKTGPQIVQVTVSDESKVKAEALAKGLQSVVAENVKTYHDNGVPEVSFTTVADESWTSISRISAQVVVLATFVFSLLFLINAVLLFESVKRL